MSDRGDRISDNSSAKLVDSLSNSLISLWSNKYFRVLLAVGTFITGRKVYDIVRRKLYHLPPGPVGIPLIGSPREFGTWDILINAPQKYGPIHMFSIGMATFVFLNDYDLMMKCFRSKDFAERKVPNPGNTEKPFGVASIAEGWEYRRKLMIRNLVSPLNGRILTKIIENAMEKYIFTKLDSKFINNDNNVWYIREDMSYLVFVTIYGSIYGEPIPSPSDELFNKFHKLNYKIFDNLRFLMITRAFLPEFLFQFISVHFAKIGIYYQKQHKIISQWMKVYDQRHSNTSNQDSNEEESNYYEILKKAKLSERKMVADMIIGFKAGSHSTAISLEQCVLYLAKCGKEYQNELYFEIKNELIDKADILNNRNKLPKLRSFIQEVLRMGGISILTLVRNPQKDIKIDVNVNGKNVTYIIPKNASVFGNIAAINNDSNPQHWGDGFDTNNILQFNPKRFYNENTNQFIGTKQVSTFGAGRRDCAGQQLALRELFVATALLIQRYQFGIPSKYKSPNDYNVPRLFFDSKTPMLGVSVYSRDIDE